MRYYLIHQDKGYKNVPKLTDWFQKLSLNNSKPPSIDNLAQRTILEINSEPATVFTDVLVEPLFLITEEWKKCMALYEPNLQFKEIILLDKKRKIKHGYFLPQLWEIDCLTENSEFGFGHYELKKIEIDEEKLGDKAIFRIAGMKKDYILARLDMIESLLRRGARGIMLEEVAVRKQKEQRSFLYTLKSKGN